MSRAACAWPLALLLLSGCGMYGPLYVEEEPPRVPEITEAPPIVIDGPAADEATDETGAAPPKRDDEDDTAGGS